MDTERFDSRNERNEVTGMEDDFEENGDERFKDSGTHRSRDRPSSRKDEKDHRNKERDRELKDDRVSSRDRKKDERDERDVDRRKDYREERDKHRDKERERERDRDRRDRETDKENDHRSRDKERGKDDNKSKEKGGRDRERDRVKEKEKDKQRAKERDSHRDGEKERDREKVSKKRDEVDHHHDREKDDRVKLDSEQDNVAAGHQHNSESVSAGARTATSELQERISKAKEERAKKKSEGASELMDWVNKSRKLEEKRNAEREKAAQLARMFDEQDNVGEDSEDEDESRQTSNHLAGVKVLHGLDKVIEGGAVVLTLKDQNILADGDVNEEIDMLENVEIGEQKRRDEAYKASKKKTGVYDDKFNDDPATEKKMLPQYDDPVTDEGVTLDARGHLTREAEKKLEELRKRLEGASTSSQLDDLNSTSRVSLDYYTQEEMVQFKKPKKKKSLRKKQKLDLDALEAEAISAGLGAEDLGSRDDARRQAIRQEQEKLEAERRNHAYQTALSKAEEASKLLRLEQTLPVITEDDENAILDEDEDFYKSLERARKIALKKQKEEEVSGPKAVALLATTTPSIQTAEDQNQTAGEAQENKVVITEMEEFVWGLQLDEESRKPDGEDVFMDDDDAPVASDNEQMDEAGGEIEVTERSNDDIPLDEDEEITPDETIHEAAVGKGLSGALKLLKERGTLKETVEWGGRNMDKKKSKLVGITDQDGPKEIRIERRDEFGRILTPKEAFRTLSHKFHGKGPGKRKQEKRMKQYEEELKLKQMKNADTPSLSAERMREAQAQMKTPYLVLSGHVKPGQNSDPRSAFATIEKDTGSLTPMLGDRKVEHFLGIKRKPDSENMGPPKKPKT